MKLRLSIGLGLVALFIVLCSCEDVKDDKSSSSVFARFSSAFLSSSSESSPVAISAPSVESSSSEISPSLDSLLNVESSSSAAEISSSLEELSSSAESSSSGGILDALDECASEASAILCDLRDGKRYRTVKIGTQVWMAQNLNFATEGSWCYENKESNCERNGRLYTWVAALALPEVFLTASALDSLSVLRRGVCPEGWHIPANDEMKQLYSFVRKSLRDKQGNLVEGVGSSLKMKTGWEESDEAPAGSDRFGFSAVPSGYRNANGEFDYLGEDGNFWVAAESSDPTHAPYWNLYFANEDFLGVYNNGKSFAYSVRCLKDSLPASSASSN